MRVCARFQKTKNTISRSPFLPTLQQNNNKGGQQGRPFPHHMFQHGRRTFHFNRLVCAPIVIGLVEVGDLPPPDPSPRPSFSLSLQHLRDMVPNVSYITMFWFFLFLLRVCWCSGGLRKEGGARTQAYMRVHMLMFSSCRGG